MTRRKAPRFSEWQRTAVRELRKVSAALPDELKLLGRPELAFGDYLRIPIRLNTSGLEHTANGLPLPDHEDFVLWIGPSRLSPPAVQVEHNRFVGFPHVMLGRQLCIYLDAAREWNPRRGIGSAVDRLYDWLADAAADRFDPNTSLYHAVGGVLHSSSSLPTVVVRSAGVAVPAQSGYLTWRSDRRLDLHFERANFDQVQIPVISLSTPLPLGIGHTFLEVLARLDDPLCDRWLGIYPKIQPQSPGFLTALAASASRMPEDTSQMFILQVPHPTGGLPHILAGHLPRDTANQLRRHVRDRGTPLINIDSNSFDPETFVEWCPVSDERASVTTRRDTTRPVNTFYGKTVHIWGCGGLGSWIAEFVARAGVSRIVLCDPGKITGGLLVRQNFTEPDIGNGKAAALRDRIQAIRDDIEVEAHSGLVPAGGATTFATVDVIIDATISQGIGQVLDELSPVTPRPYFAQVATDVKTGTLGILTVSSPDELLGANEIDRRIGEIVVADGSLEPFHTFWTDVSGEDELVPTRGCSVPTFHGSAADMAAIAASLTSILGNHIGSSEPVSGTHLIALPYSPSGPFHKFILANQATSSK